MSEKRFNLIKALEQKIQDTAELSKVLNTLLYDSAVMHFLEYTYSQEVFNLLSKEELETVKKTCFQSFKDSPFYKKGLLDEKSDNGTI